MFFSWGSARHQRTFFNAGDYPCPHCSKDQPSDVILSYTVRHVWYLFRWVTGKACEVVCLTCQIRGGRTNVKAFEARLSKPAIPFLDRMGWAVGVGALGALVASVAVAEGFDKKVYNKISGVSAFAASADSRRPDEYLDEVYFISTDKLIDMRQHGKMLDVVR